MPATKKKAPKKITKPVPGANGQPAAERPWEKARAHHVVESDTLGVCVVTLVTEASQGKDPDRLVNINVRPRLLVQRYEGEFQYPSLRVRTSELDDLIDALRLCIDEARRTGVLPLAENRDRRFHRMSKLHDTAAAQYVAKHSGK